MHKQKNATYHMIIFGCALALNANLDNYLIGSKTHKHLI
jgi:hypothetical protein